MESKTVAKVGGVVLLALILFGGLFFYLSHINPNTYRVRVRFDDTKGLSKQSVVRMQGVNIGEVSDIKLDTSHAPFSPVVVLSIKREYSIPTDYEFAIASGILITTAQVEVRPPPKANPALETVFLPKDNTASIQGMQSLSALASISPDLDQSVKDMRSSFSTLNVKLNQTFDKLNRTLDSTQPILKHTDQLVMTTRDVAGSAKEIIADGKVKQQLTATVTNFRRVSEDAKSASSQLTAYVTDLTSKTKGPLEKLPTKLNDVLSHVDQTLENADSVVNKLTEQVTDPRFQQSLQETAELARTTLARFNQIATDLHELTGDPRVQNDIKLTVENLRVTTEKSQMVVDKFNTLLGKFVGADGGSGRPKIKLPHVELTSDISEQLAPSRLRLDVNATFDLGRNEAVVGLYDLGQNTRLNLQAGSKLTDSLTARYGLYASKIGLGLDYNASRGTQFRADLWNTTQPRLDLRSSFRVNNNASVWIGADSLFRRPVPIIGVQLKN